MADPPLEEVVQLIHLLDDVQAQLGRDRAGLQRLVSSALQDLHSVRRALEQEIINP